MTESKSTENGFVVMSRKLFVTLSGVFAAALLAGAISWARWMTVGFQASEMRDAAATRARAAFESRVERDLAQIQKAQEQIHTLSQRVVRIEENRFTAADAAALRRELIEDSPLARRLDQLIDSVEMSTARYIDGLGRIEARLDRLEAAVSGSSGD